MYNERRNYYQRRSGFSVSLSKKTIQHARNMVGIFVLAILCMASFCFCQTTSPQPTPLPTPTRTDVIFVPYDRMTGPDLGPGQSILIPYAEFLKLKKAAGEKPEQPDFSPMASLVSAIYRGDVNGEMVEITAEMTIDVFAHPRDTLEVVLPFERSAIEEATIEGNPSSYTPLEKSGGIRLVLRGEGQRIIKIKFATPLVTQGVMNRIEFKVPRAAASSLTIAVKEDVVLETTGEMTPASASTDSSGTTLINAAIGSQESVVIVYRARIDKTGVAAQTRFAVQEDIFYEVASQSIAGSIALRLSVLTGSIDTVKILLPEHLTLQNVSGTFVKDWTAPNDKREVTIALIKPVSEDFELRCQVIKEKKPDDSMVDIPEIRLPDAVRESGFIRVKPGLGLTLWTEIAAGVEETPVPGEADLRVRGYRFEQPGWSLRLSAEQIPARIRSEGIILYDVTDNFVALHTKHSITIGGRGIFSIILRVPEGYTLREAGPESIVAGFRQQGKDVEINLKGEQTAGFVLELGLQRERTPSENYCILEPISVLDAEKDTGKVVLSAPRALRATEIEARGLEPMDVRTLLNELQGMQSPDTTPVLAYRYFNPVFEAKILIERQRTRVTCETARLVSIMPTLMRIDSTFNFNVEFSATDIFYVLLPAMVGEDVRFIGADIKEKSHAPFTLQDEGLTTWTIRLQRRIIGPYQVQISFDAPIKETEAGKTIEVTVPAVRAAQVARETGYIAVSRGENLEVRVARSDGLEARDIKELPQSLTSAFLGFRYFDAKNHELRLELIKHEIEGVLGAIIRRVHMESVINDQMETVHEVIYEVQNNREQYLELKLGKGMDIWSAFVRGVPVRPITRESDSARLIELTKSETRDSAFRVRLIIKETLGGGKMGRRGTLSLKPPQPMNIPVLRTTWKLYLPRGFTYLNFGGTMRFERSGKPPWIEPAAERLLNDIPASLAGGVAQPSLNPPVATVNLSYDTQETEEEKRARLQGTALEFPIVKEGVQIMFSKLSGVGTIEFSYWKSKSLLLVQVFVGLVVFIVLLIMMGIRKRPGIGLIGAIVFFIAASLTDGLAGRLCATSFAMASIAFILSLLLRVTHTHGIRRRHHDDESTNIDVTLPLEPEIKEEKDETTEDT